MAVKLTEDQQEVLKSMIEYAEIFADQIHEIMKNHGLDKVNGCRLSIIVEPEFLFATEQVIFGHEETDAGIVNLTKGRRTKDEKFTLSGKNSYEYEKLFADETIRSILEKGNGREKPLPPDGLWVGADRNSDPVDGWEWDVNDSLS